MQGAALYSPSGGLPLGHTRLCGLRGVKDIRVRSGCCSRYLEPRRGMVLFSRGCCDRRRGDGFKVHQGRFRLERRKKLLMLKVVQTLAQVAQ